MERTFRAWHVYCQQSVLSHQSILDLVLPRKLLKRVVCSSRVSFGPKGYTSLMSHTFGNSLQNLLADSCRSGILDAEHAVVWRVVWVATAGLMVVAAEVVEQTSRRRIGGRPWKCRYTSLVALFMSTRVTCRAWGDFALFVKKTIVRASLERVRVACERKARKWEKEQRTQETSTATSFPPTLLLGVCNLFIYGRVSSMQLDVYLVAIHWIRCSSCCLLY